MPNYRVRIEVDMDADEPYNDGSSPLLRMTTNRYYGGASVEQVKRTSYEVPENIIRALERWADEPDTFERYLKAFHGTRSIVWYTERDGGDYVTFDTADWRASMGLTDEFLATPEATGREFANLDEWRAYCEGDVYGFIVEEETTWTDTSHDGCRTMVTWEHVDSCWGFYGYAYAEEAGEEALSAFTVAS